MSVSICKQNSKAQLSQCLGSAGATLQMQVSQNHQLSTVCLHLRFSETMPDLVESINVFKNGSDLELESVTRCTVANAEKQFHCVLLSIIVNDKQIVFLVKIDYTHQFTLCLSVVMKNTQF